MPARPAWFRGIVQGQRVDISKVLRAKELRRDETEAERTLWERLRARRLDGFKFRRQQVIDGFIVDFFCNEAALVIEIDGSAHDGSEEADFARTVVLNGRELLVIRFTNDDVAEALEDVCATISRICRERRESISPQ